MMADLCWGPRVRRQFDSKSERAAMAEWTRQHARRLADHPGMLMASIGNEIPPLMVRWYGRAFVQEHLRQLCDIVKTAAPEMLVTYAHHPPTECLDLPFLDVLSFNVYLEREREFRAYLARLHPLAGERPLLLAEIGLDSARHGNAAQAQYIERFLQAAMEKGLCGAALYSWTDEWSVFAQSIDGWGFGLTRSERKPRPSFFAARALFSGGWGCCARRPGPPCRSWWPATTVARRWPAACARCGGWPARTTRSSWWMTGRRTLRGTSSSATGCGDPRAQRGPVAGAQPGDRGGARLDRCVHRQRRVCRSGLAGAPGHGTGSQRRGGGGRSEPVAAA